MKELNRYLGRLACISILLVANAAVGGDVQLTCPSEASVGESVLVTMDFSNRECAAQTVRIMSSVVGNAKDSLAGIGIFGPVVARPVEIVPAGTDRSGGCDAESSQCEFSQLPCTTDADCPNCSANIPGTLNISVDAGIALPVSISGTVATQLMISEFDSGFEIETEINECMVEVLP